MLPLPPRPDIDHYRKRAKDLVRAARSTDDGAVRAWAAGWHRALATSLGGDVTPFVAGSMTRALTAIADQVRAQQDPARTSSSGFALADAQLLIARAHGFESWARFAGHVQRLPGRNARFEAAADAVVDGDLPALQALVAAQPDLARTRSTRVHHATLLHYVAANGIEDFRQRSPKNAADVARFLLESGADADALADTYGRDRLQTTMNLLVSSGHPVASGVQVPLVDVLVDYGAQVNGLDDDGSPLMTAIAFGYRDAAEALVRRGARVDTIVTAAALGRADLVGDYLMDGRTLRPGVPLVDPPWFRLPKEPVAHIELALSWACRFGRGEVAHRMLDRGVSPRAHDKDHMTALHWASASGLLDVVDRLIRMGALLEARNDWGGTVLDSTLYFVRHDPAFGVDYLPVIGRLLEAGADVTAIDSAPTGDGRIDDLLRDHRPRGS
jgi:ankyrin repeat protein